MPEPPDGFTEFVSVRSATLLRSAWLLTVENRQWWTEASYD